jgi:hypothetical protein
MAQNVYNHETNQVRGQLPKMLRALRKGRRLQVVGMIQPHVGAYCKVLEKQTGTYQFETEKVDNTVFVKRVA